MAADSSKPTLGAFRGDFDALAAMMQASWAENRNQSLLYSEEFLRSAFDYPGSSFDLAPALYGDDGLAGFVAGFPRPVRWDGQLARFVISCFLTASTAVKGSGVGLQLWAELIRRSREKGYDGVISYCIEGDEMSRILPVLSRLLKLNTQRIFSIEFMVRLLRPAPPEPLVEASDADIDLFLELASALPDTLPLVRVWTREEAEWQCRGRAGAIAVASRVGERRGMMTGYLIQEASTPPTTVVLLEDLLWGDLEPAERTELMERFLGAAAAQGARFASCPLLGYASPETLIATRFRRSQRVIHTYLTSLTDIEPRPVPALYLDVF